MHVYVSGPMRGRPSFNFPAFMEAAEALREMGHVPINPAQRDIDQGFDPSGLSGFEDLRQLGFDLRRALAVDAVLICDEADAVLVLDGWQGSKGATAEVALARACGIPVLRFTWALPGETGRLRLEEVL